MQVLLLHSIAFLLIRPLSQKKVTTIDTDDAFHVREFNVSQPTIKLIQSLLVLDPSARLTASETLARLKEIMKAGGGFMVDSDLQVGLILHVMSMLDA